jgi:hypothetical protein
MLLTAQRGGTLQVGVPVTSLLEVRSRRIRLTCAAIMKRFLILMALLGALYGTVPAALAVAATGPAAVIADCNSHNQLTRSYAPAELKAALTTMPASLKEYTDCYDVIDRALITRLSDSHLVGGARPTSSGGSFLSAPVIVVLVALLLAAGSFGALALRRRASSRG